MNPNFKNKNVLVMGYGLYGGGAAVTEWLVKNGANVTVTDLKTEEQLGVSKDVACNVSTSGKKVTWILGRHRESDFKKADIVIQNPGVPKNSKYLSIAKRHGAVIENDASLFLQFCPAPVIAITGTRGKSTTSALIYELLQKHYAKTKKVFLVGLPQRPELAILNSIKKQDLAVVELSSWQLEGLSEKKLSSHGAVVTNIYPDHLNRHKTMKNYIAAKSNIFKFQSPNDFLVINHDNKDTRQMGKLSISKRIWFSSKNIADQNAVFVKNNFIISRNEGKEKKIIDIVETHSNASLRGAHNLENILAAIAVARQLRVSVSAIKSVLKTFSGLPSRLELVSKISDVSYYNDTTATTPDGTIAALATLKNKRNIILIAGGADKKVPQKKFDDLSKLINKSCKAVILFDANGSKKIKPDKKKVAIVDGVKNMSDAFGVAKSIAKKDDIILLSPAFASFGMFVNEYDRGDQFNELVRSL